VRLEFVGNSFGTVDLIVPLGTGIRLDGLQLRGGTVDNRLPPSPGPWPLVGRTAFVSRVRPGGRVSLGTRSAWVPDQPRCQPNQVSITPR
jgi:hypothetical protein